MKKVTRRDALKTVGALAGTLAGSRLLSACGGDDGGAGTLDTFVFLMMENRSYDHYLGVRSLEGRGGDGLFAAMSNPDRDGNPVAIWRGDGTPESMCADSPPHSWNPGRVQLNGGACDGFVLAHQGTRAVAPTDSMQYLGRDTIPVHHALADAYTSCDRWFSSLLGPTLPNRMYWHAATSNGARSNDEVLAGAWRGVPSIYHRLAAAGKDWAYYFHDVPVVGAIEDLDTTGHLRRFFNNFITDARDGVLPPVSYIDPAFLANDDHPPHHPALGQQLIAAVYQALATSPQWERCLLVVTYDEWGGFHDHVAPPTAPDERADLGFNQLGFRVPALVAGPWAKPGYVSSVPLDHTSPLRHLEKLYGLEPLTMRDAAANDLTDCIDLERLARNEPLPPIQLPAVEIDEASLPDICRYSGDFLKSLSHEHDLLAWADAAPHLFGRWDRRAVVRDDIYGIAEYLDQQGLGRIRRR
jgi:phospholipase C